MCLKLGCWRGRSPCLWDNYHTHCSAGEGEFTWNSNPSSSCIVSSFSFSSFSASDLSTVSTLGVLLSFVGVGSGGFLGMAFLTFTPGSSVF